MADISKDTFDRRNSYKRVIFQKKKPIADFELNELQDIYATETNELSKAVIGKLPYGDGFKVEENTADNVNKVLVKRGLFTTPDGVIALNDDAVISGLSTPGGARTDTVFLTYKFDEIDSVADPGILDPLVSPEETAVRSQLNVTLAVAEGVSVPSPAPGEKIIYLAELSRLASDATVTTVMITDKRENFNANYVETGLDITPSIPSLPQVGSLSYTIASGDVLVKNTSFAVGSSSPTAVDNSTNYAFVDGAGTLSQATSFPGDPSMVLFKIVTLSGDIVEIEDLRVFVPVVSTAGADLLAIHKAATPIDHPDDSVTDAKIGNRTIDDTQIPATDTNDLETLLSNLGNRLKKITEKSSWKDDPDVGLATILSLIQNVEQISGVPLSWVGANTVEVGKGAVVFDNEALLKITPVSIVMGTDMDDGENPETGGAGSDTERHSAWYYLYAKPNAGDFDPVLSTAPPNEFRRSARLVGSVDDTFNISGTNDEVHVQIDGGPTRTCTLTNGGTQTATDVVDDLNDATKWGTKPAIRAYVVGGSGVNKRVALAAIGAVGGPSTIKMITGQTNPAHATLGLVDDGTTFSGQNWKYLGVVRNDLNANLFDFRFNRESGLFTYRGQSISLFSTIPAGPTEVFNGVASANTLVDLSEFVPVGSNRALLAVVTITIGSTAIGEKAANALLFVGDFIMAIDNTINWINCSDIQKIFIDTTGAIVSVYGFYLGGG